MYCIITYKNEAKNEPCHNIKVIQFCVYIKFCKYIDSCIKFNLELTEFYIQVHIKNKNIVYMFSSFV